MECIICLTNTYDNDYIITECCNQPMHIECLKTWIERNIDTNVEIDKCFYCKNNNDYINNIIYLTNQEKRNYIDNSLNVEDLSNSDNNSNPYISILIAEAHNINNSRYIMTTTKYIYYCIAISTTMVIFYIIGIILYTN